MLPGFFSAPMRSMLLVMRVEGPLHKLARLTSGEFSPRAISRLRGELPQLLCAVLQFPIAAIGSPWNAPQANHASPSVAWISMIFLGNFSKMTQRSFFSSNASILNIGGNYFSILFNCNILSNCDTSKFYPCLGGLPWQKAFLLFAIPKQGKLAPRQYKRDSLSCRCVSLRRRRAFLLVKEDG